MTYQEIQYDVAESVLTITLNRPDKLNAFTATMAREMLDAFDQADRDDAVRAIIVTGAGRGFCAGADLSSGGATFDNTHETIDNHRDTGGLVSLRIYESKKPVIAAINGPAVGVGITMTLPMDIRIASSAARIGFVFARRGIVPEACSSYFLPRVVGISQAAEWVYTGRVFEADEALRSRLVSRVVEPEALLPTARALAREIADNTSAMSVTLSRALLWRMLGADHPMEAHKIDSKCIYFMGRSPDAIEGVTSFLQKRPAQFAMKPSSDMPPFYPWWGQRKFK
ncbi:MAG: crotonase/enoyl-CoA hydratase family protein [Deltaproteobacteria bacterium]|nr:crotonase/enoyl-CoA hydratase family protein [Deltaproteobacteria bacterium]MBI3386416.1 crotonase/enoyl-CoA hydratase family protein [Deltaproteobacteria bacterium]